MNHFYKSCLVLLIIGLILNGCKKEETPAKPSFTDEQIEQAYQKIKQTADAILLSDDPIAGFEAVAEEYRKMEEVEKVEVNSDGIAVELKNGFISFWNKPFYSDINIDNDFNSQNFVKNGNLNSDSPTTTNKKMCWIIQISETDFWKNALASRYNDLAIQYQNGWDVDIKLCHQATLDFFMNDLNNYDALLILTHGGFYNDMVYLATGSQFEADITSNLEDMGSIAIFHCLETRNDRDTIIIYQSAISTAMQARYEDKPFNNTFVYTSACHGLQNTSLANAFTSNGAAVFVGWTETNCYGFFSGRFVFNELLQGSSIQETINYATALTPDKGEPQEEHDGGHPNANLTFHPQSAASFRLIEPDVISTDTPPYAASTNTWTFGGQTWSDAIRIPECNRSNFIESFTDPQCRSYAQGVNTWYYYNWLYVNEHSAQLCPAPWRVPTKSDFDVLVTHATVTMLSDAWGYGGYVYYVPILYTGSCAVYWSATESGGMRAYSFDYWNNIGVGVDFNDKELGYQVRCVK
jgi:hypothetical protein